LHSEDLLDMPQKDKIDRQRLARRVAQEFRAGEVVGLGPGMPTLISGEVPAGWGVWFLADSGALGYRATEPRTGLSSSAAEVSGGPVDSNGQPVVFSPGGVVLSLVDVAAMIRGGHVGTAVLQPARVRPSGDFTHWTTADTPGLFSPASAVDWASGSGRVIAMMPHTDPEGFPNIVAEHPLPLDGVRCVDMIITDVAVFSVASNGLMMLELAPGWRVDDVAAITGASLKVSPDVKEMTFDLPHLEFAGKVYSSGLEAVQDLPDDAVVNIDGFGGPGGMAHYLLTALRDHGAKGLTLISNTAGIAGVVGFGTPPGLRAIDHSILVDRNQVAKAIASFPVSPSASRPSSFELAYQRGEVELELVPQGTLAERLRSGGAGVGAFYTPTGAGTLLAEGKETRIIDGKEYVLETGLTADYCLIRGHKADTLGNVVYKGTSRNFNAVMAPAARVTVVEVDEIVEPGTLSPEEIITPGVYVDRIVQRPAGFSPYE
jgi:3-oxoacid CoA-transferase A subunit/3-oxoacid CoA-transferase B subunit